eukprot:c46340_g1_i1 orf=159-377(+)
MDIGTLHEIIDVLHCTGAAALHCLCPPHTRTPSTPYPIHKVVSQIREACTQPAVDSSFNTASALERCKHHSY